MKARAARALAVAGCLCAGGTVACADAPPPPVHAPAPPGETMTSTSVVPDATVVRVLGRELRADSVLAESDHRGHLRSRHRDPGRKRRLQAGKAARGREIAHIVRGARAIVDRIEVVPNPRPDYELEFAVASGLSRDPVVGAEHVSARARDRRDSPVGRASTRRARVGSPSGMRWRSREFTTSSTSSWYGRASAGTITSRRRQPVFCVTIRGSTARA